MLGNSQVDGRVKQMECRLEEWEMKLGRQFRT